MTLVIMAAGMGSRYGGIKQIDPMGPNGEIILDYSVRDAAESGFDRVVFIIRRDIEAAFREVVGRRFEGKITVDYAFQELEDLPEGFTVPPGRTKPWGTGHAILCCRALVSEPFVVINADDFYGAQAFREGARGLGQLGNNASSAFLVGYRLVNTLSPHGYVTRGVCEESGGRLSRVTERMQIGRGESGHPEYQEDGRSVPLKGDELVSMNFWGFSPSLFAALQEEFRGFLGDSAGEMKSEFLIPSVVDTLISSGRMTVKVHRTDASWFGVTYPEDKSAVKAALASLVERGVYPSPLW